MANDTALHALAEAADALVDEARSARDARVAFAQENRDAHAASASRVGELAGKVDMLAGGITSARVESAGAIAAAAAMATAATDNATALRRMLYAVTGIGSGVLIALTFALLYAVLTLRGIDAEAAIGAGSKAARDLVPSSTVTTATSSTITTTPAPTPPEGDSP